MGHMLYLLEFESGLESIGSPRGRSPVSRVKPWKIPISGSSGTRMKTSADMGERISSTGKEDLAEFGDSRFPGVDSAYMSPSQCLGSHSFLIISLILVKKDPVRLAIQLDWTLGLVFRNLGPVAAGKMFSFRASTNFLPFRQSWEFETLSASFSPPSSPECNQTTLLYMKFFVEEATLSPKVLFAIDI